MRVSETAALSALGIGFTAAGAALLCGMWEPLYGLLVAVNPVSAQFEPVLAGLVRDLGAVCLLAGVLSVLLLYARAARGPWAASVRTAAVASASLAVYAFFTCMQPQTALNGGMAWDGTQYCAMAHFFRTGAYPVYHPLDWTLTPVFPYSQRIALPWLVSLVPLPGAYGFALLNALFIAGASAVLYRLWTRVMRLPVYAALAGLSLLWFSWVGPVRSLCNCAFSVDAPVYFFGALTAYAVTARKGLWLLAVLPVATLFKEQFVYVAALLAGLAAFDAYRRGFGWARAKTAALALVLALAANFSAAHLGPFPCRGFGGLTAAFFLWKRLCEPLSFVRFAAAVATAYGAVGLLALVSRRRRTQTAITFLALLSIAFAFFGGSDATRISFVGFPFIMTWVLAETKGMRSALPAWLMTLPVMRLVQSIPEPAQPVPLELGDIAGLYSWYPEFMQIGIVAAWGVYFLICAMVLVRLQREDRV